MARRTTIAAVAVIALATLATSCGSDGAASPFRPPPGAEPKVAAKATAEPQTEVRLTRVATFPTMLTSFDTTPGGEELLVGDRQGVVRRLVRTEQDTWTVAGLDEEPVLDLSREVDSTLGERGFFDLKVTDDGRWMLVDYTATNGTITVERFPYRHGEPIDRDRGRKLVELPHPYAWHHGGGLTFDADGNLYVGIGDMEFRQIDPPGPQDPNLMLGGIMRVPAEVIEDAGTDWEPTPDDMVARGLRNPWRLSIDRATGDLWIGEVGLADIEEVDRLPASKLDAEVVNFGWPYLEGSRENQGTVPEGLAVRAPVLEREHTERTCGMVGGFRYRGELLPDLTGSYVYTDLCSDTLRAFEPANDRAENDRAITELPETPISMGEDEAGELYVLGREGGLYRVDPPDWDGPPARLKVDRVAATTTAIERSSLGCDGVVAAVEPLQRIGALDAQGLEESFTSANQRLAVVVPEMPDNVYEDGVLVQKVFLEVARQLAAAGWDPDAQELRGLRSDSLTGTGVFLGFPDAMARIVDSECG